MSRTKAQTQFPFLSEALDFLKDEYTLAKLPSRTATPAPAPEKAPTVIKATAATAATATPDKKATTPPAPQPASDVPGVGVYGCIFDALLAHDATMRTAPPAPKPGREPIVSTKTHWTKEDGSPQDKTILLNPAFVPGERGLACSRWYTGGGGGE